MATPAGELESDRPGRGRCRERLGLRGELLLALAPTAVVLGGFALVDVLTRQRLLFASLASSTFLIYLDPEHGTNAVRTLVIAHLFAATAGLVAYVCSARATPPRAARWSPRSS